MFKKKGWRNRIPMNEFIRENKIEYTEIDIEKNLKAKFTMLKNNMRSLSSFLINGEPVVGLDKKSSWLQELSRLLRI